MGDAIRYLLACGLEPLLDEVPGLIRDGRLALGVNDIALAIFVSEDGRSLRSYAKPREHLKDDLRWHISAKMLALFAPTASPRDVPVYAHFRDDQFAFVYILPATAAGAGVLS
jgi:hypothetical protein